MDSCSGKKGEYRIVNYFRVSKVRTEYTEINNCVVGVAHVN